MKKILLIHTGGTIGSTSGDDRRIMSRDTAGATAGCLIENFSKSGSAFAEFSSKIEIADYSWENISLSESMTLDKLTALVKCIDGLKNACDYAGVIVLHGTDTLAYTASLLSMAFADFSLPIFLVSGNKPPYDINSNANANFRAAIELIYKGIAPNVYVCYRNSDGVMRLYLASSIMQSANFSVDFCSASARKVFAIDGDLNKVLCACKSLSDNRSVYGKVSVKNVCKLSDGVLLINAYTGLDYSIYEDCLSRFSAVVHGTYHSGTVAYLGLVYKAEARKLRSQGDMKQAEEYELKAKAEENGVYSIKRLADGCAEKGIPLFIAPSKLGNSQYETMNAVSETCAQLLNMTTETAYMKLILALSCGLNSNQIEEYMNLEINNEMQG